MIHIKGWSIDGRVPEPATWGRVCIKESCSREVVIFLILQRWYMTEFDSVMSSRIRRWSSMEKRVIARIEDLIFESSGLFPNPRIERLLRWLEKIMYAKSKDRFELRKGGTQ